MVMKLIYTLAILTIITLGVLKFYLPLGAVRDEETLMKQVMHSSYQNGAFINQIETKMDFGFGGSIELLKEWIWGEQQRKPKEALPMADFDMKKFQEGQDVSFMWVGHSALLMNWKGNFILLDPMFGKTPSPFPWLGGERFTKTLPFELSELPTIDAVFLSHDHYDHLDYGTIQAIDSKVQKYFVPLGVGAPLERWGVDPTKISEYDWWSDFKWNDLEITFAPARHFSGRSLTDRNASLWGSWIFRDVDTRVYFSGDSGYAPHFKEIGEKYGPFDLAFLESGQYNESWQAIHMMPEEVVQAGTDLKAKEIMPIHWGAFVLSLHDWFEPPARVVQVAEEKKQHVLTPMIGQIVQLNQTDQAKTRWWEPLK